MLQELVGTGEAQAAACRQLHISGALARQSGLTAVSPQLPAPECFQGARPPICPSNSHGVESGKASSTRNRYKRYRLNYCHLIFWGCQLYVGSGMYWSVLLAKDSLSPGSNRGPYATCNLCFGGIRDNPLHY